MNDKEVVFEFKLDTQLFTKQTAKQSDQLLPSVFYSKEEIKTLLEAYIHSQRNAWTNSITMQ